MKTITRTLSALASPLTATVLGWLALAPAPAAAQATSLQDEALTQVSGNGFDSFGRAVAVTGNRALIAGNGVDTHGAAFAYQRIGGVWTQVQKFTGSDTVAGDFFGFDVDLDGLYAVVGADQHDTLDVFNSGAAYVYEYVAGSWIERQKLTAFDPGSGDHLGRSVAIGGDLVVVGSSSDDDDGVDSGSAYVWRRSGNEWIFEQKLTASTADVGDQFGWDVTTDGQIIVVSAIADEVDAAEVGAVFVFEWDGSTWTESQRLLPSDGADADRFGWRLDLNGDALAIGATDHDSSFSDGGAVYVFRRSGSVWSEEQELVPSKLFGAESFGWSIALQGDRLVAGAPGGDSLQGALYNFHHDGTRWVEVHQWLSDNPSTPGFPPPQMGMSCALAGTTVFGGAPFAESPISGVKEGVTFRYTLTDLGLQAPATINAGETLELTTWGGLAGDLMGVLLFQVEGVPFNVVFGFDLFDADGKETFSIPLSPTTAGFDVTFLTGGYVQDGVLAASNVASISIQ